MIVDQLFYDIQLNDTDELGKELLEVVKEEQQLNKDYHVVIHQVIPIDKKTYTVILNILEIY